MSEDKQKNGGERAHLLRELQERNQELQAANQQLQANEQQLQAANQQLRATNQQLRATEQTTRESERRFRSAFDHASVGRVLTRPDGRLSRVNEALGKMLGYSVEELREKTFGDITHPEDLESSRECVQALLDGEKEVWRLEKRYLHKDGHVVWADVNIRLLRDDQGEPLHFITDIVDITERVKLQAQMAQSDRLASMGMLAASVAHEINNPLSYVLYNLESLVAELPELISSMQSLLKTESGARDRKALDGRGAGGSQEVGVERSDPKSIVAQLDDMVTRFRDVLGGTQRIREVTRGLGTFSRVERDELVSVDLNQVLELAVQMARNEIKYRARLVKELGDVPKVMGTEGRLSQVFLNLLINATHAIEEGAVEGNEIRVSTWQREGEVFAQVKDTGCGIPRDHLDRLFEPFFSTKEVGKGSGLGLPISQTIVETCGGRITVESEPGVGTKFTVMLPAAGEVKSKEKPPDAEGEAESASGRILVVDDEEPIRVAMERMLSHHETVGASSGAEAKEILEDDAAFDLILCDMMMPEFSGMDLHKWLREAHPFLAQHLIFITGGAFTPKAREYLGSVENNRIEKPFDMKKLIQRVDERVKRSKEARHEAGRSDESPQT